MVIACLVGFSLSLPLPAQERKLPEPTPLEQEEKTKLINRLFKSEYSKRTNAARSDLAKVLLSRAKREKNDMGARFVLLREAIHLSARSADLPTSLSAFQLMEGAYVIDPVKIKESLLTAFPRTRSLIIEETIFDEWMGLVDTAIAVDDYSAADRFAAMARKRSSRDKLLLGIAKDKQKYIKALEKRFRTVKSSFGKLADDPENVEANGTFGEFLSLYKREWRTGLAMVAKGPAGDLKKLAAEELDAASVPLGLQMVAESWWEKAQDTKDVVRTSCLLRAAHWYRKVLSDLEGSSRGRIEKRLGEIEKAIGNFRRIKLSELQVLCYEDKRWRPHPLEKMALSRRSESLTAKNTSGISSYALLSSKRLLRGDFSATVQIYGGRTLGITSTDMRSKRLQIELKEGWQHVRVERVGKSLTFAVNGKLVKWEANSIYTRYYPPPNPEQTSYLFVSLNSGQQCSIRTLGIEASTKEFGDGTSDSEKPDDDSEVGRGKEDDDRDRGRGRSSGRDRRRDNRSSGLQQPV